VATHEMLVGLINNKLLYIICLFMIDAFCTISLIVSVVLTKVKWLKYISSLSFFHLKKVELPSYKFISLI